MCAAPLCAVVTASPASMGNKTEQVGPLVWGLIFAIPVFAYNIFNLEFQTYV